MAFSPDERPLATVSGDGTARLWHPATGAHLRTLTGHTSCIAGVAFRPDGRLLVTAGDDKTARLWDQPGPAGYPACRESNESQTPARTSPDPGFQQTATV